MEERSGADKNEESFRWSYETYLFRFSTIRMAFGKEKVRPHVVFAIAVTPERILASPFP